MRILQTGVLAAALIIGAAAAHAEEVLLSDEQLENVTAGILTLPEGSPGVLSGLLDGLPELLAGLPDGFPELPAGLPDGFPELPAGLPDGISELPAGLPDLSNILSIIGDLPVGTASPS